MPACDRPGLGAFTRLDDLGLDVMGQGVGDDWTVLACKVAGEDRWCRQRGGEGVVRDTVIRRLAQVPYGWHLTILHGVCTPLPLPGVCSRVASQHERGGRSAREALARSGALGAGGPGGPPFDGGTHRRRLSRVMEHCQYRDLR